MDQETKQFLTEIIGVVNKNAELLREEMHDGFGKLSRRMGKLEHRMDGLEDTVADLKNQVTDLNAQVINLNGQVININTQVTDLNNQVIEVEETTRDNNRILLLLEHNVNEKIDVVHDDHEQTKQRVLHLETHAGLPA